MIVAAVTRAVSRAPLAAAIVIPLVVLATSTPVDAQQPQQPPEPRQRPFTGLFAGGPPPNPNRSRTELSLTGSVFYSYDDDLAATAPGISAPSPNGQSGNPIQGSAGMRYYYGKPVRNIVVDGNGYVVDYGQTGVGVIAGGGGGVTAVTQVGRADQFRFDQRFSYDPLFSFGPTAEIPPVVDVDTLPPNDPATGIFERASWGAHSSVGYSHELGRRSSLDLGYDFEARLYGDSPDPTANLGDSTSHEVSTELSRNLSRTWSTVASYRYYYARPTDIDGVRPVTDHNLLGGLSWSKHVSRTRTLSLSFSGGAHNVRSTLGIGVERTPFDYWAPSGSATVGLDLSRSWNLSADYRRVVTVVPEVTTESFLTDAVMINARGLIGTRLELQLSASRDWSDAGNSGSAGTLDSTTIGVQTQFAITRMLAATFTYTLFDYEFQDVGDLPPGFAPQTRRNAVRGGITLWLPLIGRYDGGGRASSAGRP